ncbi:hypothetical protein HKD37_13G035532 [Glycine soja]
MGSKIYPKVHENPKAFFINSSPILLEPLAHGSGEKREVVATQLAQASWVSSTRRHRLLLEHPRRSKWACLLFAHPC